MNLIEKIYNHQKEITALVTLTTVIALEETYIGIGREQISNLLVYSKELINQFVGYFDPNNLY